MFDGTSDEFPLSVLQQDLERLLGADRLLLVPALKEHAGDGERISCKNRFMSNGLRFCFRYEDTNIWTIDLRFSPDKALAGIFDQLVDDTSDDGANVAIVVALDVEKDRGRKKTRIWIIRKQFVSKYLRIIFPAERKRSMSSCKVIRVTQQSLQTLIVSNHFNFNWFPIDPSINAQCIFNWFSIDPR